MQSNSLQSTICSFYFYFYCTETPRWEPKQNRCCTSFISIKHWNRESSPRLQGAKLENCTGNTNKKYQIHPGEAHRKVAGCSSGQLCSEGMRPLGNPSQWHFLLASHSFLLKGRNKSCPNEPSQVCLGLSQSWELNIHTGAQQLKAFGRIFPQQTFNFGKEKWAKPEALCYLCNTSTGHHFPKAAHLEMKLLKLSPNTLSCTKADK